MSTPSTDTLGSFLSRLGLSFRQPPASAALTPAPAAAAIADIAPTEAPPSTLPSLEDAHAAHTAAESAAREAASALARADAAFSSLSTLHARAEEKYAAYEGENVDVAGWELRDAKEQAELAYVKLKGARTADDGARAELAAAKMTLESVQGAVNHADALKRADLSAFTERQAPRAFAMRQHLETALRLAEESDADFAEVNAASVEAGIEPLDTWHLISGAVSPTPAIVDAITPMRQFDKLTSFVSGAIGALSPPRGMAATPANEERARADLAILDQHRGFSAGARAVEKSHSDAETAEARRKENDPEEIERRQAWIERQKRLAELGTPGDPFTGYRAGADYLYSGWGK